MAELRDQKVKTSERRAFMLIEEIRKTEAELVYIAGINTTGNLSLYLVQQQSIDDVRQQINRLTSELLYPHKGFSNLVSYYPDEIYTQIKQIRYKNK